jgi:hypothetical protein
MTNARPLRFVYVCTCARVSCLCVNCDTVLISYLSNLKFHSTSQTVWSSCKQLAADPPTYYQQSATKQLLCEGRAQAGRAWRRVVARTKNSELFQSVAASLKGVFPDPLMKYYSKLKGASTETAERERVIAAREKRRQAKKNKNVE